MIITNYYRDEILPVIEPAPRADPRPPEQITLVAPVFLTASQREAADDIQRSLDERHVYAAVTGAPEVGKTVLLAAVTAAQPGPAIRVIRLDHPDRISVDQALQTERMMTAPASARPGSHTVLIVDNADRASAALLRCLTRVAETTRMRHGSPQLILAGRPELWDRLADDEFTPLRERIAVRLILRPMTDEDARGLIRHLLNEPRKIVGQALADDAEREVLRLADGKPERIGALVRSTLMPGDLVRPQLSADMFRTTAEMLDGKQLPSGRRRASTRRPAWAAALAVAAAGGLVIAARSGRLDPMLLVARSVAAHIIAGWTPPTGNVPAWAAVALTPPPAVADGAGAIAAGSPPPLPATEPAPPETRDVPAIAASTSPPSNADLPKAELAQDGNAASEPVPTAEAAAPPRDAEAVAAEPPQAASNIEATPSVEAASTAKAAPAPTPVLEAEPAVAGPNAAAMPVSPPVVPAPGMVATLLRRGDEMLALGDVSTARRFYERTIPDGSALGARGVARTYDPAVLGHGNPAADPSAAAAWYDRAARLEARSAGHTASAPSLNAER